ncbi:MAG: glycerol kinase GlpK [Erysipelotrichaceae bacterium]|jgi:glycerol kinase|nr:glycerol kinase GlpK [Bacilli bacterium]NLV29003.1 glycerol kinase GlpK [Erysipelotrichaceae bacterium]HPY79545.1 glycerol kinase GlpK [Bacilli bacterium]HQA56051.1 glycerol kinase GlpK [Bacilli bacterium]
MKKFILSLDQGTTSTRAILFDNHGLSQFVAQREIQCLFPHSGWVEADALSIWVSVIDVINEVLIKANITMNDIDSIGLSNQRETTVVWSKETGMPIYHAIIWQSRQSAEICDRLSDKKDMIHQKTGLPINPYFSASKIRFILDQVPGAQKRAENGELLFGTIDSWLIYKMTKGKIHATDISNASRTLLFNINTLKWDKELCDLFHIPIKMLPSVKPSSYLYGTASFFHPSITIQGVAGDQQAALFGQTCFEKGESKNTYGTGCFMLLNTGDKPVFSHCGLLTTVAWQIGDVVTYALEGSVFVGGAAVQWLRDEMNLIHQSAESERAANLASDTEGLYLVPAFVGLGTPYWDDDARGAILGITRATNKNQIIRATLEGIAYQCKDVFFAMDKEAKCSIRNLRVDGGATANKYLMQFQSDVLQVDIMLPHCLETTALGVAYLAGLNSGFFKSIEAIKKIHSYQCVFKPGMNKREVDRRYRGWKKAIAAVRKFKL